MRPLERAAAVLSRFREVVPIGDHCVRREGLRLRFGMVGRGVIEIEIAIMIAIDVEMEAGIAAESERDTRLKFEILFEVGINCFYLCNP